jgi:DNA-binding response OmpR family regulator
MRASHKVLVVEDHDDTRELYMTCLSLEGFEVRGAVDGADGIAQVRAHRPDLVLLDFALPRMNGAEVLREIRRDPDLSGTAVVLVSAQMRLCLAEVEGLLFHAALEKPCELDEVLGAVRSAISA